MKALIFTEGGGKIGFGHVTRCLALRDALKAQGVNAIMIVNGDSRLHNQFPGQLDMVFDWRVQKIRIRKLLKRVDIVIVDSYLASIDFYREISKKIPVRVYLDDFFRLHYPPGIIVNGAIDAEKLRYPKKKNLRYLLGVKYALLRKEFRQVPKRNTRREIRNVLVTFGGINHSVFIHKMLFFLRKRFPKWHFLVIAKGINAQKMKKIMFHCDLAISGGGQTTNELAACGTPTIGISLARNQQFNLKGWQRHGALEIAGQSHEPSIFKNLESSLRKLTLKRRIRMGKTGQKLVDGAGASRLTSEILDSCFDFQNVRRRDRKQIFKWSNSPGTRAVSFNTKPIKWNDHCRWFAKKLKDSRCSFLKIMRFGRAIGQIRFERSGKSANLSVALDKKFQGRGLGANAIRLATQQLFKTAPGISRVDAFVKRNNAVSRKAFLNAGFRPAGKKLINHQKAYRFTKGKYENVSA